MTASQKRKVLYLAADPINTPKLSLDQELRDIETALQLAPDRDLFQMHSVWAVRTEDMRRAMLKHAPQIVHFAGHGDTEGIYLLDNDGRARIVSGNALGNFMALFPSVECIVLNACYTSDLGHIISQTVPCVIGLHASANDTAAITFAVAFYDAIGAGGTYNYAYNLAVNALELDGMQYTAKPELVSKREVTASNRRAINSTAIAGKFSDEMLPPPVTAPVADDSGVALAFAQIYGITVGVSRYEDVRRMLGEPEPCNPYNEKPVLEYSKYGLRITLEDAIDTNPHINLLRISAEIAPELPLRLHKDMLRPQWEKIMRDAYGPPMEGNIRQMATFVPEDGRPGNAVRIILQQDRISSIIIYQHNTSASSR